MMVRRALCDSCWFANEPHQPVRVLESPERCDCCGQLEATIYRNMSTAELDRWKQNAAGLSELMGPPEILARPDLFLEMGLDGVVRSGDELAHSRAKALAMQAARPLRQYREVAYGFLAFAPAAARSDGSWKVVVQRPFRALKLFVWPGEQVGKFRFSGPQIDALLMAGDDQLVGSLPAYAFLAPFGPGKFLEWLEVPHAAAGLVELAGVPLSRDYDPPGGNVGYFPSIGVGAGIEVNYRGKLEGLVLVGSELVE